METCSLLFQEEGLVHEREEIVEPNMEPQIGRMIGIILLLAEEEKDIKETKKMTRNPWLAWNHLAEEFGEKLDISNWVQ